MSLKFKRKKEDFVCENCKKEIIGNGYTNHCYGCLWSKHVDINPGDREATCLGLMKPIGIENEGSNYLIIHKCQICGHIKRNNLQKEDDFEQVIKITKST